MAVEEFSELDNEIIKDDFVMKDINLLIWPLIRYPVLSYFKHLKNKTTTPHAKQSICSIDSVRYVFDTLWYAPHKKSKGYDVLFYTTARGRLNDNNFNMYCDFFSSLTDKSLVIDNAFRGRYFIPDDTDDFATRDYIDLMIFLFRPLKKILINLAIQQI